MSKRVLGVENILQPDPKGHAVFISGSRIVGAALSESSTFLLKETLIS